VEAPLMSRDNILHRIRTALGRSAGQAVADFPPARIRIPDVDIEKRIATMFAAIEALAGKTHRAATPADARAFRGRRHRGQERGGLQCALPRRVRNCHPPRRALRHRRSRRTARLVRRRGCGHHQRGLRARRHRLAGHDFEPA